ncbi:MAG: polymer-forming cytoskeletal protein [Caldisericia bacterium]|nr:polymer-forming cytoskeletal protein [Caldisericia bacterium]
MNNKIFIIFILIFLLLPGTLLAQGIIKGKGDIIVKQNEEIRGDIRLGEGNVTVYGRVLGNIIVLKGNINLKNSSFVRGDIITYNGKINIDDGAIILGRKIEFIREGESEINIPQIFLSGQGFLLKIVIALFIFLISFIFNAFLKNFVSKTFAFLKNNFLIVLFTGILLFTIFIYNIPKEALFPFGKILYLLYLFSIIVFIAIGIPSIVNFLGESFLKIFKTEIEDNLIKDLVLSLIGTAIILVFIIIPIIGNILLGIICSISFGLTFFYSLYKIFKSQ